MRDLTQKETSLLDEMFDIRKANNLNWRMALENLIRYAPKEVTMDVFQRIYDNDHDISMTFAKLRQAIEA